MLDQSVDEYFADVAAAVSPLNDDSSVIEPCVEAHSQVRLLLETL
jgi:hypothetical protein